MLCSPDHPPMLQQFINPHKYRSRFDYLFLSRFLWFHTRATTNEFGVKINLLFVIVLDGSEFQHFRVDPLDWAVNLLVSSLSLVTLAPGYCTESTLIKLNDDRINSNCEFQDVETQKVIKTFSFHHLLALSLMKHSWPKSSSAFLLRTFHKIIFYPNKFHSIWGRRQKFPCDFHFYFVV